MERKLNVLVILSSFSARYSGASGWIAALFRASQAIKTSTTFSPLFTAGGALVPALATNDFPSKFV